MPPRSLLGASPVHSLRRFWPYAGPGLLGVVGLTLVGSYAEGIGLALVVPLLEADRAGSGLSAGALTRVLAGLGVTPSRAAALPLLAAMFALKGALQYVRLRWQTALTHRVVRALRHRLLTALGAADYRYVAARGAGAHANLIVTEVNRFAAGVMFFIRVLSPLVAAGVLAVLALLLDWRLVLEAGALGLPVVALLQVGGRIARRHSERTTAESARLSSLVVEVIQGFRYLRTTDSYPSMEARLLASSDRLLDSDRASANAGALVLALAQPLAVLILLALVFYRAQVRGQPIAALLAALLFLWRILGELLSAQTAWQGFCALTGSLDALEATIDEAEAHREPRGGLPFDGLEEAITCRDVSFAYAPERPVLRGVTLRIPRRTTVAFVGESGAGKSTLIDLLTGTLKPTSGEVALDGHDLAGLDLTTLRRRVGFVPQEVVLFEDTVAANIALGRPSASRAEIAQAAEMAQCAGFIEALPGGYDAALGPLGRSLSTGQRQRIAIARELVRSPELLVLDEATSALDNESQAAILRSLERLRGRVTILIIAHRASTILACDHAFVLSDGRLVEEGPPRELATRPGGHLQRLCALEGAAPPAEEAAP